MTKSEIIRELRELIDKLSHEGTLLTKNVFLTYLADESTNPDESLYIERKVGNGVIAYSVRCCVSILPLIQVIQTPG